MATIKYENEIENILWKNKELPYNGELYFSHLGIVEKDFPKAYDIGYLQIKVIALKKNCRVYLKFERNKKEIGYTMATFSDLPQKTIKDIWKIMKKYKV